MKPEVRHGPRGEGRAADSPAPPVLGVGAVVLVPAAAIGAAGEELHVLLVRRGRPPGKGTWSLPGGRVKGGERLVDAAAREVLEETALAVEIGELLEAVELVSDEFHYVVFDYRATLRDTRVRPVAGDDADDARFVALSELGRHGVTEAVARVVARAVSLSGG